MLRMKWWPVVSRINLVGFARYIYSHSLNGVGHGFVYIAGYLHVHSWKSWCVQQPLENQERITALDCHGHKRLMSLIASLHQPCECPTQPGEAFLFHQCFLTSLVGSKQSARRGHILLTVRKGITHPEVTFALWGFCTGKFQDGWKYSWSTWVGAMWHVNKASAKAFEPRVTWNHCILAKMS